ncbi:MAG: VOC family protein [Bacteroidota bacterium]
MKGIAPLLIFALISFLNTEILGNTNLSSLAGKTQVQSDSLKNAQNTLSSEETGQIYTFLTYQEDNAEEAMNFYVGLFENSRIINVQRYGKEGPAKEGTIMMATFELNGSLFACSDSYIKHEWDFTPGVSIFVECKSDAEIKKYLEKLAEGGSILMPLDNYGWSSKFAFVVDKFGVSWQLNLD